MRILAIDGNSIMNRAFYGIKLLTNKKGVPTNAILGFMKILIRAIEDLRPDSVVVAFDLHAPTFRHKAVETYKANRKGMPPELQEQMPIIKDLLRALGYKILEIEGYEADDILGTISKICTENNTDCIILTGDRDNLQLIGENVSVRLATTKENIFFDTQKFREEYGFEPINLIDLKALMGDSSDNISGVPGIGEKTATALILDFATVENLYENLDKAKISAGMKAKLESGKSLAEQSKWLATIVKNVPIDTEISAYQNSPPDEASAAKILTELGMFNLLEKLNFKASIEVFAEENPAKIEKKNVEIAFENFTDSTISSLKQANFILTENLLKIQDNGKIYEIADEENILKFLTSDCKKRTSTAKNAYEFAQSHKKCLVNVVLDAEIADYLISSTPSNGSVERLCGEYGVPFQDFAENSEIANLSPLCDILEAKIDAAGMKNLLMEIEQPLTEVLASMEVVGVKINADGVRNFGEILKSDLHKLEVEIYNLAGSNFNISSPKQLGVVLFEQLGLPCKKKTKTGYSTNVDVLESLREKHPIIEPILKYRQLSKLNSTYVEGLLKVVGADGRIHSNFKQTETRTGRISSTEPNVQNIPVRTELGSNMRKFFVSDDGKVLLDADYSQIELRILASICGDKTMQSAFSTGIDIHTLTAAQVFGVPTDMVTPAMRRAAKAVNFGIIYGIGAFSLSKDIGVSVAEADTYIKKYLNNYPNVKIFMDKTIGEAVENGYVTTIFGRRRYIPELSSSNKMLQAFGKRAAMNAPIQGSAADIIKIAMVKVFQKLRDENLDAKLILQVHDELIVEVGEKDADRAAEILQFEMENAVKLDVPLTAEVNRGRSWYDAKG